MIIIILDLDNIILLFVQKTNNITENITVDWKPFCTLRFWTVLKVEIWYGDAIVLIISMIELE